MAFGVNYQSGAPIIGALVAGQGQARERDEQQAVQQQQFLAQMLQRANEFNRSQKLREQEASFGQKFGVAQLQQRERLARMQQAAQQAAQAQQIGARERQMAMGHGMDLQKMGLQADIQGQQAMQQAGMRNQQQQEQNAAQLAMQRQAQDARGGQMRDQNIWQANMAAMDAEASALMRHNKFHSEDQFNQVWGQHNRKRQMMGLPAIQPPPYQEPPPDPKVQAQQEVDQKYGPLGKYMQWDPESQKMAFPRGFDLALTPEGIEAKAQADAKAAEAKTRSTLALEQGRVAAGMTPDGKLPDPPEEEEEDPTEVARREHRQKKYDELQKAAAGANIPTEVTQSMIDAWDREFEMIHTGKAPELPGGGPGSGANSPGVIIPGSKSHTELTLKINNIELAKKLTRLPIIRDEAAFKLLPPGEFAFWKPDGSVQIFVKPAAEPQEEGNVNGA